MGLVSFYQSRKFEKKWKASEGEGGAAGMGYSP